MYNYYVIELAKVCFVYLKIYILWLNIINIYPCTEFPMMRMELGFLKVRFPVLYICDRNFGAYAWSTPIWWYRSEIAPLATICT